MRAALRSCTVGSGLIYVVILGLWAAYLVPVLRRRHDEMADISAGERFSEAMHLLARRSPATAKTRSDYSPDSPRFAESRPDASGDGRQAVGSAGPASVTPAGSERSRPRRASADTGRGRGVGIGGPDRPDSSRDGHRDHADDRNRAHERDRAYDRGHERDQQRDGRSRFGAGTEAGRRRRSAGRGRLSRVLVAGSAALMLAATAAVFLAPLPWWGALTPLCLIPALTLVGWGRHRRRLMVAREERSARRRRVRAASPAAAGPETGFPAPTAEAAADQGARAAVVPQPASRAAAVVEARAVEARRAREARRQVESDARRAAGPAPGAADAPAADPSAAPAAASGRPAGRPGRSTGGQWEPIPVTLPTYVTKPRAPAPAASQREPQPPRAASAGTPADKVPEAVSERWAVND